MELLDADLKQRLHHELNALEYERKNIPLVSDSLAHVRMRSFAAAAAKMVNVTSL